MLLDPASPPRVKVLDFGIARMVGGENLTMTGEGFGTPAYMSPERISGAASNDPRIDIYSVGLILYEMLTGNAPFDSAASDPVVYWMEMRALHEKQPLPSLEGPGIPRALDSIVQKAAAKRVEERYTSADEMQADISLLEISEEPAAGTRLSVCSKPAGVEVFVDGVSRGKTDHRGTITVPGLTPGFHDVRLVGDGYNEHSIGVKLEEGRETELQVSLAARPTVAAPIGVPTSRGGFETVRFQDGDEAKTAVLVIDSLPAGASIAVAGRSVAMAGEDGKATLRLAPGDHEISVTAGAATVNHRITLTDQDLGGRKTVTMAMERETRVAQPESISPRTSPFGKRMATAGVVVLLVALVATAAYVFVFQRGRPPANAGERVESQVQTPAQQDAANAPAVASNASPPGATGPSQPDMSKQLDEARAENARLEKKLAEEKKEEQKKEGQPKADPPHSGPAPSPPVVTPPETPPAQPPPPPASGKACLMVSLKGPQGQPGSNLRVVMVEQSDSQTVFNSRSNPLGRVLQCGFTPNRSVRVSVFGPRGALLGTSTTSIGVGRNFIEMSLSPPSGRDKSEEGVPLRPGRKRPFPKQ
jgi:hypothetical protein